MGGVAGLAGLLGGGAKGYGEQVLAGESVPGHTWDTAKSYGWKAGLGGALLGLLMGHLRQNPYDTSNLQGYSKSASLTGDPLNAIIAAITSDGSASTNTRQGILERVFQLSASERTSLWRMISMAGGAGAAMIAARFLGGGLLTTLAAGSVGGALGSRFGTGGANRRTDFYGKPF
jgi:hypothetical protein